MKILRVIIPIFLPCGHTRCHIEVDSQEKKKEETLVVDYLESYQESRGRIFILFLSSQGK